MASGAAKSAQDLFARLADFFVKHNDEAQRRGATMPFEMELQVLRGRMRAGPEPPSLSAGVSDTAV